MKALRAEGMGFDRIAAKLNEEGTKPRRGARWWGLTVNNILTGRAKNPSSRLAGDAGSSWRPE